jgi:hypothetical protein
MFKGYVAHAAVTTIGTYLTNREMPVENRLTCSVARKTFGFRV